MVQGKQLLCISLQSHNLMLSLASVFFFKQNRGYWTLKILLSQIECYSGYELYPFYIAIILCACSKFTWTTFVVPLSWSGKFLWYFLLSGLFNTFNSRNQVWKSSLLAGFGCLLPQNWVCTSACADPAPLLQVQMCNWHASDQGPSWIVPTVI